MSDPNLENEIESKLTRIPRRALPVDWKRDILFAAKTESARQTKLNFAAENADESAAPLTAISANHERAAQKSPSKWKAKIREFLWPSPIAWGALAASWIGIAIFFHEANADANSTGASVATFASLTANSAANHAEIFSLTAISFPSDRQLAKELSQ